MSDAFDFSTIDGHLQAQEDGREVAIVLPNGKPTGLKVMVSGPDSERVRKAIRWARDQLTKDNVSDERRDAIGRETTARCCSGWSGAVMGGAEVAFSADEAVRWFARWPFIERQISAATNDAGRFMPA